MSLISASDLRYQLASVRLLDARPDPADFAAGHLPESLHADLNRQLSIASEPGHDPARGGRHPLPDLPHFAAQVGAWGIGPSTRVVLYDAAGGGNAAARLWWMLRALGHEEVHVLDGGLPEALRVGMTLTSEPTTVTGRSPYPAKSWQLPTVDAEAVETLRKDRGRKLLDVRSRERWHGHTEPFDPVAGHIPGSLNLPWNENLEPDGCFKSPAVLRALYSPLLDGTPPERLAVHCGSGVTACHTLLALEVAGLPGAALYVGSWSEWCRSGRERGPRP